MRWLLWGWLCFVLLILAMRAISRRNWPGWRQVLLASAGATILDIPFFYLTMTSVWGPIHWVPTIPFIDRVLPGVWVAAVIAFYEFGRSPVQRFGPLIMYFSAAFSLVMFISNLWSADTERLVWLSCFVVGILSAVLPIGT